MSMPKLTEQQDRALRLILSGARQKKIAKVLGVSPERARDIVRRLCAIFDVYAMHEIPDAYADLLEGHDDDDDMPDDGVTRVDGTHSGV